MGNRLKRVFPKFEVCASYFRRVNGRSKFAVVQSAAHKNKWAAAICTNATGNSETVDISTVVFRELDVDSSGHWFPKDALEPMLY